MRYLIPAVSCSLSIALTGCALPFSALAPGAAEVRVTQSADDVASCTAVGNVRQPQDALADPRNLTVGLGGNTLFVTEGARQFLTGHGGDLDIKAGVAYRCP